ncbi:DUF2474 family protein [Kordiimonas aestuarii]|nr:DUF2474 family protein [Kordiimonas aestuarii]
MRDKQQETTTLWRKLAWFGAIWTVSVLALAAVGALIRWALSL